MSDRPDNLRAYKTTPHFTTQTVPSALTRSHRTKSGVWGRIEVLQGMLHLTRFGDDGRVIAVEDISAGETAIVHPEEPHCVALADDSAFFVTFLRQEA